MDTYQIISVVPVEGKTLNPRWHSPMQKIITDKGEFIDNAPGNKFGPHPPGFDWKSKEDQTVQAEVVNNSAQQWLRIKSDKAGTIQPPVVPADNLATTSTLAKQLGIKTKEFTQKLVNSGYLELQDGEYHLTPKGKKAGGEPRVSKEHGPYFMWPLTLEL